MTSGGLDRPVPTTRSRVNQLLLVANVVFLALMAIKPYFDLACVYRGCLLMHPNIVGS
jgi:hypothetical protein